MVRIVEAPEDAPRPAVPYLTVANPGVNRVATSEVLSIARDGGFELPDLRGGELLEGDVIIIGRGQVDGDAAAMHRILNAEYAPVTEPGWVRDYITTVFPKEFSDVEIVVHEPGVVVGADGVSEQDRTAIVSGFPVAIATALEQDGAHPHRVTRVSIVDNTEGLYTAAWELPDAGSGHQIVWDREDGDTQVMVERFAGVGDVPCAAWDVEDMRWSTVQEYEDVRAIAQTRPAPVSGIPAWTDMDRVERVRPSMRAPMAVNLLDEAARSRDSVSPDQLNRDQRAVIVGLVSAAGGQQGVAESVAAFAVADERRVDELAEIARQAPEGQREWVAAAASAAWKFSGRSAVGLQELDKAANGKTVFGWQQEAFRPMAEVDPSTAQAMKDSLFEASDRTLSALDTAFIAESETQRTGAEKTALRDLATGAPAVGARSVAQEGAPVGMPVGVPGGAESGVGPSLD